MTPGVRPEAEEDNHNTKITMVRGALDEPEQRESALIPLPLLHHHHQHPPHRQQHRSLIAQSPSSADSIMGISQIARAELEELCLAAAAAAASASTSTPSSSTPSSSASSSLSSAEGNNNNTTTATATSSNPSSNTSNPNPNNGHGHGHGHAAFPAACRAMLLEMEGNSRCVDCGKQNPEWAAVSYGAMICLQCAGMHRSMGVQVSTVRSVTMDHWRYEQVVKMLEGGNRQLSAFFQRHALGKDCVEFQSPQLNPHNIASMRYKTKAALFYRQQLDHHVQHLLQQGPYKGRRRQRQQQQQRRRQLAGAGGGDGADEEEGEEGGPQPAQRTGGRTLGTQTSNLE